MIEVKSLKKKKNWSPSHMEQQYLIRTESDITYLFSPVELLVVCLYFGVDTFKKEKKESCIKPGRTKCVSWFQL